jgi:roadblock/LC7 domain-containing protein
MAELGVDSTGKQPPALTVPRSKKALAAGKRMDKRRIAFVKGWMARRRAGHKAKMAEANKAIRKANAGARMNRRRAAFSNQQRRAIKAEGRGAGRVHRNMQAYGRHRVRDLRAQARAHRKAAGTSKRAIKAQQRSMKPRVRAKARRREFRNEQKAHNLLWLARLAKRAFKKRSVGDGRNHGARPRR